MAKADLWKSVVNFDDDSSVRAAIDLERSAQGGFLTTSAGNLEVDWIEAIPREVFPCLPTFRLILGLYLDAHQRLSTVSWTSDIVNL